MTAHHAESVAARAVNDEARCDHICLKDDGHVERGEPHFYGYESPSPRRAGCRHEAGEDGRCRYCGLDEDTAHIDGEEITPHEHVYRCQDCGEIGRGPAPIDGDA